MLISEQRELPVKYLHFSHTGKKTLFSDKKEKERLFEQSTKNSIFLVRNKNITVENDHFEAGGTRICDNFRENLMITIITMLISVKIKF